MQQSLHECRVSTNPRVFLSVLCTPLSFVSYSSILFSILYTRPPSFMLYPTLSPSNSVTLSLSLSDLFSPPQFGSVAGSEIATITAAPLHKKALLKKPISIVQCAHQTLYFMQIPAIVSASVSVSI